MREIAQICIFNGMFVIKTVSTVLAIDHVKSGTGV